MIPRGDVTEEIPRVYDEKMWFWLLCGMGVLLLVGTGFLLGVWFLRRGRTRASSLLPQRSPPTEEPETRTERARGPVEWDEKKNDFLVTISHELRTPLTLLRAGLDDALDGTYGEVSSPLRHRLKHMHGQVRRLRSLTDRLLDLSRLEAAEPELHRETRDLVDVLRQLVQAFVPAAERKGVHLERELAVDSHLCRFDPDKLESVFGNLISNALTVTPAGGQVTVSLDLEPPQESGEDTMVIVQVADTGRGLPEWQQEAIFERFASFHPPGGDQGTGMGLALAREFTQLHGGTIELESTRGAGSTFTVHLPLPSTEPEDGQEPSSVSDPLIVPSLSEDHPEPRVEEAVSAPDEMLSHPDRPLLLIVDDNADVRAYLRRHLSTVGSVMESANGADALDAVRRVDPDLVLANVMMPKLDGLTLTRRIRADEDLDRIPILLVTARAAPEDAVDGLEAGADDYVRKPFSIDELRARIERLMAARRAWAGSSPPDDRLLAPTVDVTPADEGFLDRVTDVIDANLARSAFTVEDLADGVGVSPRHLQRKIKRLTGCPAGEFVRRYRLECAADLLAGGAGSVSKIAYSVGFGTSKTFVKHFKNHYDCTPSTYAERHSD